MLLLENTFVYIYFWLKILDMAIMTEFDIRVCSWSAYFDIQMRGTEGVALLHHKLHECLQSSQFKHTRGAQHTKSTNLAALAN